MLAAEAAGARNGVGPSTRASTEATRFADRTRGMVPRVPHLSLLAKFSVLTLICVVAFGAALAVALREQVEDRAAADARDLARETANDLADEHVMPTDLEHGLDAEKLSAIDRSIEVLLLRGTIRNAKIYDGAGRLVYSLKRDEIGERHDGEIA